MGKLVVVYGMDGELEEALDLLRDAGVTDEVRVVQRPPNSDEEGDIEAGRRGRGAPDPDRLDDVVVPPSATLGTSVPLGTPAAFSPFAVVGADAEIERGGATGYTRSEIEDLTGARAEEAEHLLDVVRGGGSLLVVEGNDRTLDLAQRTLEGHSGQGATRI